MAKGLLEWGGHVSHRGCRSARGVERFLMQRQCACQHQRLCGRAVVMQRASRFLRWEDGGLLSLWAAGTRELDVGLGFRVKARSPLDKTKPHLTLVQSVCISLSLWPIILSWLLATCINVYVCNFEMYTSLKTFRCSYQFPKLVCEDIFSCYALI